MTVIGDPGVWADTFPEHLIPRLLDQHRHIGSLEMPEEIDLEVPITRRFKLALKKAKDYRKLPVRIERESTEDDSETGEERGRIDLKFCRRYLLVRRCILPSSASDLTLSMMADDAPSLRNT